MQSKENWLGLRQYAEVEGALALYKVSVLYH